tara:strand:- start:6691 stop:7572 length:882 start_codon:yes stop_codon:yes gene_type:complete
MKLSFEKNISSKISEYHYLIAEIGINHNGSLEIAKKLIDNSKMAGFDAVKFQKRDINTVYSEEILNTPRESPWGTTTREQKEGLEFSIEEYKEIDNYCKSINMPWFVSCWDINSQKQMRIFSTPFNKIASAMATNRKFVKEVASERKGTFASTGMMEMEEIEILVKIFEEYSCPLILMHTVSTYPSKDEDLNLKCIETLSNKFNVPIGYSGHEVTTAPSIYAALLGAVAIERHVTLDRAMYGSDQSASLEKEGMYALCSTLRKINICMGDGIKKITKEEYEVAKKLRYWRDKL